MNKTKALIANLALAKIGAQPITTFDEVSPTAEQIRTHYDVCLSELLRSAPWGFAIARANTAALAAPAFGWTHAYQLPVDCIQILEVNGVDPEAYPESPFAIEGGAILCNEAECKVRYVKFTSDPNDLPWDFIEAFATLLASRVCVVLTGNWQLATQLQAEVYGKGGKLSKASGQNTNENRGRRTDLSLQSDLVAARWG